MDTIISKNDRDWGMYSHLAGLLWISGFPFAHIIGPLACYLKVRDESPFSAQHARESLNFQITITLWTILFVVIGFFVWIVAVVSATSRDAGGALGAFGGLLLLFFGLLFLLYAIVGVVSCIRGAMAASKGEEFRYPFSLRLVR